MKPDDSFDELVRYARRQSAREFADLTPAVGVEIFINFCRDVPAEGCSAVDGGDILLFQWGVGDCGDGERFDFGVTRQFTKSSGVEDLEVSQLSLAFRFIPDAALRALGSGERWCCSRKDLASFHSIVASCDVYEAVAHRADATVDLGYAYVEHAAQEAIGPDGRAHG